MDPVSLKDGKENESKEDPKIKTPEQIVEEADNLLKNRNVFTKISEKIWDSKNARYEKAASMYTFAGTLFKVHKEWKQAAFANIKSAGCYEKMKASLVDQERNSMAYRAGTNYIEAAENMKKVDIKNAITLYERARDSFLENGNLYRAGKIQLEKAKLLEENMKSLDATYEKIVKCYQKAEGYMEMENKKYELVKIREKIGELLGLNKQYKECAELFETMIDFVNGDNVLKYRSNGYIYRFLLCLICLDDTLRVENELIKFKTYNSMFRSSKERSAIDRILKAYENTDIGQFDNLLTDIEVNDLGSWESNLLFEIKDIIKGKGVTSLDLSLEEDEKDLL